MCNRIDLAFVVGKGVALRLGVAAAWTAVVAAELIGAPSGLDQAIRMCAYAGTATLVGMPVRGTRLDADLYADVFSPKVTIAVTHGGDTIPQEDFPFLAQAALEGKLDLARFVSRTLPLEDVPDALEHLGAAGDVRAVALL